MTSILFGILEVAGDPNGKDARRALEALQDLRAATLNGHDVLGVIDTYNGPEPTHIKHYGYNYRCTGGCDHEDLPWGVERYFGINLVVSGDWDIATYPLRYWVNPDAQILVVGETGIHAGKRKLATLVAEDASLLEIEDVHNALEECADSAQPKGASEMTESKRTPGPWALRNAPPTASGVGIITADREITIGIAWRGLLPNTGLPDYAKALANAAFIVRAVNAHDALVSALEPFVAAYAIMSLDSDRVARQCISLDFDGSYAAGSDLTQDNLFDARLALALVKEDA